MKKILIVILAIAVIFGYIACGDSDNGDNNDGNDKAQVSAEMKDFMNMLNGTTSAVNSAMDKYANDGVDRDITSYELADPKIKEVKEKAETTCYILSVKSGATRRKYDICWSEGKITSVDDLGFDFE